MPEVTAAGLVAMQNTYQALFYKGFEAYTEYWRRCAMAVQSMNRAERYDWLGALPELREWLGPRVQQALRGFHYELVNQEWEMTIPIMRTDYEDNQLGQYPVRIMEMGAKTAAHPDKYLTEVRMNGTSGICYDGKAFYANDHSEGDSGVQDNLLAGTGDSLAQVTADFESARASLRNFKNDRGQPFNQMLGMDIPLLVTIPPQLEGAFRRLRNNETVAVEAATNAGGSQSNTWRGSFDYMIDARLSDSNDWYMDFVGDMVKPFIKQDRRPVEFYAMQDPMSETVRKYNQYEFGTYLRYTIGYGMWQFSVKVAN